VVAQGTKSGATHAYEALPAQEERTQYTLAPTASSAKVGAVFFPSQCVLFNILYVFFSLSSPQTGASGDAAEGQTLLSGKTFNLKEASFNEQVRSALASVLSKLLPHLVDICRTLSLFPLSRR